jgi:hypothetical protein
VSGPQYGSLIAAVMAVVVPLGLIFWAWAILAGTSLIHPVTGVIAIALSFILVLPRCTVEVDDFGVRVHLPLGSGASIPWSDIEALEGHRFSARLLKRSNGRRVYVQMFDPKWSSRPVSRAIHAHLATAAHQRTSQS